MAKNNEPVSVILVSPDGQETTATSPTAVNNLIYGAGYTVKSGTVADAAAAVAENTQLPGHPAAVTTAELPKTDVKK